MRSPLFASVLFAAGACAPTVSGLGPSDEPDSGSERRPDTGVVQGCLPPPNPAGASVEIAPAFAELYSVYDLGPVPGVPGPLGGVTVDANDPNVLLVAGSSENSAGAIYSIGVDRDDCGHILGFVGTATRVADAPHVDANLAYGPDQVLFYAEWPLFTLSQLPDDATAPALRTDLQALGVLADGDSGPGGVGFVPPGLAAEGQLRIVTWPAGRWYHVDVVDGSPVSSITAATLALEIPNNPGGFAYVPAGSPGFDAQAIIIAEWRTGDSTLDRVTVYDADPMGDPMPGTRREFMSKFPRPWGAYFEPVTGDYLFLSWGAGVDRVHIVQGFAPPPPIE